MKNKHWDVLVIGGGPAGMMAAGRAAERGARVLLLEKNPTLGKKLLITGGGRCNVTNAEPNIRTLLAHYGESAKFLFSPFSKWTNTDTVTFFNTHGVTTKVEDRSRVFPVSDKAASIHAALVQYLKAGNITVRTNTAVDKILSTNTTISGVVIKSGEHLSAHSYILATGGKSRPETGSTGDGFRWLATLGHRVREPNTSLVPVALTESWIKHCAGLTLTDVKISVYHNGKRYNYKRGRLLFTHVGVSGPTILNMSKGIGDLLAHGPVTLFIDLFPTLDDGTLDTKLVTLFTGYANKQFKNALSELVPSALASALATHGPIAPNTPCHNITRHERKKLVSMLKHLPLSVSHLLGIDKAIVTSGGIALSEVDTRTMRSQRYDNLYLTGDILDIDRPSGGFSLQLCWTTGFVAGTSVPITANSTIKSKHRTKLKLN